MSRIVALLLFIAATFTTASIMAAPVQAQNCNFELGFATLHDMIPTVLEDCVDNVQYNPQNGDALQHTMNGLLVWRKADNFTAFTNGHMTWVNGPLGLQQRLNTERFAWEPVQNIGVQYSCDDFLNLPAPHAITTTVTAFAGDTIIVTLCSNPSTGFSWQQPEISDTSVLALTAQTAVGATNPMPGAPGAQSWTFTALQEGTSTVTFEYSQPWQGGVKGAWKLLLDVTVKNVSQ